MQIFRACYSGYFVAVFWLCFGNVLAVMSKMLTGNDKKEGLPNYYSFAQILWFC